MVKSQLSAIFLAVLLALFVAGGEASRGLRRWKNDGHWIDVWATMPQLTEPGNLPNAPFVSLTTPKVKQDIWSDRNLRTKQVLYSSILPSAKLFT